MKISRTNLSCIPRRKFGAVRRAAAPAGVQACPDTLKRELQRCVTAASAFTMMEIAIALGVIAVALIAIMGVLPAGLQVQRDNRQETIINQDGAYLLDAIRTSAQFVPDLISYVEFVDGRDPRTFNPPLDSSDIVQILTRPNERHETVFRSISGPAAQRGSDLSFRYKVISAVTNLANANPELPHSENLTNNLWEVRLVFLWPLVPGRAEVAQVAQRHVMRTLVTGNYFLETNGVFLLNLSEFRP